MVADQWGSRDCCCHNTCLQLHLCQLILLAVLLPQKQNRGSLLHSYEKFPHFCSYYTDNPMVLVYCCLIPRRLQRSQCHPGQPYTMVSRFIWGLDITYLSVFRLQFTLKASASAEAPESPISFSSRLLKKVH